MEKRNNDPLHGVTLEMVLQFLLERYTWQQLHDQIPVNCFASNPSIKSSLTFLRKTPWARKRLEDFYIYVSNKKVLIKNPDN